MTSFAEVSALTDRELDARIDLALSTEHPALPALITERDRRGRIKLRNVYYQVRSTLGRVKSSLGHLKSTEGNVVEHELNPAQMARIESIRSNGSLVNTEPIDGYPDWVSVSHEGESFFALVPRDGGKIARMADWLD